MDYPAAHSMDTMWFAVDADGHVAAFDSGEGGGVPELAYVDDHYELAELIRELPDTGAQLDLAGHESSATPQHVALATSAGGMHVLAFVRELGAVQDLVARLAATPAAATSGLALRFTVGDRAAFQELHARDACQHCQLDWSDEDSDLAAHGVFRYNCDEAVATPYIRLAVPDKALAIGDAPASVRAHAIRFDGRFADTPQLQPAEHWKSQGWSAAWVATDGKTVRPFPGRERDFATDTKEWGDEYSYQHDVLVRPDGELESPGEKSTEPPGARLVGPGAKKPWWRFW